VGLASALVALSFLAFVASFVRDGAVPAGDTAAVEASGAGQRAPHGSVWPAGTGVGLAIVAVGIVTLPAFFILGCVVVAGLFGAVTVSKRIFLVQAMPAILALGLLFGGR